MRAQLAAAALRLLLRSTGRADAAQPVDLESLLRPDLRIVEVGSRDFHLSSTLRARGHERLLALGLVPDETALERVKAQHPGVADILVRCEQPRQVSSNSAQVLVLSEPAALRCLRRHRHAQHVLWAPRSGEARATLAFVRQTLRGLPRGLRLVGLAPFRDDAGRSRLVLVAENRGHKPETARRFIPAALGIDGFFRRLEARGVRYVVLRWFEQLPTLPPGEDLDLLVADEDLAAVEEILAEGPGLTPVDLYSESGLPGTAHRHMAHYPPAIAARILEDAVVSHAPYRVPCLEHHFLSLAYHALYHKGEASGIPMDEEGIAPEPRPAHDYTGILAGLAARLGLDLPIRLEALDEHLVAQSWRPPLDTLARLGRRNAWLARRVARLVAEHSNAGPPGLAIFLLRQRALELGRAEEIAAILEEAGFEILMRAALEGEARARVSRGARGGNWARGPYPCSGGPPALVLLAYDPAPLSPVPEQLAQHPGLENARLLVKVQIRDRLNARLPPEQRCNLLHSSDHAWGALEYLRLALPEAVDEVLATLAQRRQATPPRITAARR